MAEVKKSPARKTAARKSTTREAAPKKGADRAVEKKPSLLPCPFCGNEPKLKRVAVGDWKLWGIFCACTKRDDIWCQWEFEDEASARAFWNKRREHKDGGSDE